MEGLSNRTFASHLSRLSISSISFQGLFLVPLLFSDSNVDIDQDQIQKRLRTSGFAFCHDHEILRFVIQRFCNLQFALCWLVPFAAFAGDADPQVIPSATSAGVPGIWMYLAYFASTRWCLPLRSAAGHLGVIIRRLSWPRYIRFWCQFAVSGSPLFTWKEVSSRMTLVTSSY